MSRLFDIRKGYGRWMLLVAVLAAGVLRFWRLDEHPPGLYHDEAYNGLDALSLTQGKYFPQFYEGWELYAQDAHGERTPTPTRFPLFFEGNYGREPLHIYLMALSVTLFGPTPFAVRAVPAAAGVLAVLTTYFAATALLGTGDRGIRPSRYTATLSTRPPYFQFAPIFSAFVLAILFPAIHFSRFGLRAMVFVPLETLTVACFWRGIATVNDESTGVKGRLWFVAAGLFLGLGLYAYAAARLFPLLFIGFVLYWFWRDRSAWRQMWQHITLMAGVSLVVTMPLLIFFVRYPYFFVFRIAYVANKGLGAVEGKPWITWLNNIGRVFKGLFWFGETHLRHNLPGRPYLDPIQAVLFVIGIVHNLRRWMNPQRFFLLLWLLIMLLPTIMSGDAPHFGRMTGAAPVVAILIGMGADWLWGRMAYRESTIERSRSSFGLASSGSIATLVIVSLFLASISFTVRDYFQRYASHPELANDFYLDDWQMGQFAAAQPPETDLYLTPTQEEMATIYFALADPDRLQSYNGATGLIPAGQSGVPAQYLIRSSNETTLEYLTAYFPNGEVRPIQNGVVAFQLAADSPRIHDINLKDVSWEGQIKLVGWSQAQQNGHLRVTLVWQGESEMDLNYTAFVHLLDENGTVVAQLDRPPAGYPTADWRPGEIIIDVFDIPLPVSSSQGRFSLHTGFYYLPTLERVGEVAVLDDEWRWEDAVGDKSSTP